VEALMAMSEAGKGLAILVDEMSGLIDLVASLLHWRICRLSILDGELLGVIGSEKSLAWTCGPPTVMKLRGLLREVARM
jgi:hypothetical protein